MTPTLVLASGRRLASVLGSPAAAHHPLRGQAHHLIDWHLHPEQVGELGQFRVNCGLSSILSRIAIDGLAARDEGSSVNGVKAHPRPKRSRYHRRDRRRPRRRCRQETRRPAVGDEANLRDGSETNRQRSVALEAVAACAGLTSRRPWDKATLCECSPKPSTFPLQLFGACHAGAELRE